RAYDAALRLLDELAAWVARGEEVGAEVLVPALERATVRGAAAAEPGRVAVLDLLRARTRRFDVTFVLGLEEGSLPRRGRGSPFLDDDRRRALGRRLERPDEVARDRYLFYTACTRATRRPSLRRARRAFDRPTALRNPSVRAWLGARGVFAATELERFADCSSAWLFERVVDPKTIDAEADAMLRGQIAHQTLYKFYSGLPKEL